jgi:protein AFG1
MLRAVKGASRRPTPAAATRRLCSSSSARISPLQAYDAGVKSGELRRDHCQEAALEHLERLYDEMCSWEPLPPPPPPPPPGKKEWRGPKFDAYGQPIGGGAMYTGVDNKQGGDSGGGFFSAIGSFFGGGGGGEKNSKGGGEGADPSLEGLDAVPRGVYMHGGVGCGKSFLMDTFFDCAPLERGQKRRVHFHEFMLEVHKRMHELRRDSPDMGDPMPYVAYDISVTTKLLCFDEFQVTDVADALVMRRLFRFLFSHGLIMVATSNRQPTELYKNGIQRDSFLPFIDDLQLRCESHDLASGTDYRTLHAVSAGGGTYLHPLGPETSARIEELFRRLTKGEKAPAQTLRLRGRELEVPAAGSSVARFTFNELCGRPLGAEDYLGIASAFHTVIVEEIPKLSLNEINQVRRLITMVDAFYDQHVRLVLTAAVAASDLFVPDRSQGKDARDPTLAAHGDLLGTSKYVPSAQDEVFAFDRTLSRLTEMRTHAYLVRAASAGSGGHALFNQNRVPAILYEAGTALSKAEAQQLFTSYDVDASDSLEWPEIKLMLQDLCERRRGHRNVSDEEVDHAMREMDTDGNGDVSMQEFVHYMETHSLSNMNVTSFGDDSEVPEAPAPAKARGARVSRSATVPDSWQVPT